MKKVFTLLSFISLLTAYSCGKRASLTPLPFYNSAEFTPKWIEKSDPNYTRIHSISPFSLKNQEGQLVDNSSLEGSIYVADFFFTICPSICPKMTSNLARIQEAFSEEQVKITSFSIMPWADSVSVLKNYARVKGIDSKQWHLLTGETEQIYELARRSFFAEKEIGLNKSTDEFLHTENFVLVDQKGRIRGVYNGTLPIEMTRLQRDIETLLALG
ncbi:SCO family protein [Roseivirga sp. E12]|uniref:SCO family protein n=1 Tax=Roseivirga sp. E12 TaxID=2819237 RepID=UPI001ABC1696|nr:SCO family protein [Roseivirga sp. E12]MBO3700652.1 SCO family protein [Roseivirga sp. E12]